MLIVSGGRDKASFCISLVITCSVSHVTHWVRYTHPNLQCCLRATELNNKNVYLLQIGASLRYKLRQLCFITN